MIVWIVGAMLIFLLIFAGIMALRDPEAGFVPHDGTPLIRPRAALLNPERAEMLRAIADLLKREGLIAFPHLPMEAIFEPGRLTPTGWHRMQHSRLDLAIADARDFRPVGILLIEEPDRPPHYLEEENRELRESAISESGIPLMKLSRSPERPLNLAFEEIRAWIGTLAQSEGSKTQVDLL